jgi:hypothetical protein
VEVGALNLNRRKFATLAGMSVVAEFGGLSSIAGPAFTAMQPGSSEHFPKWTQTNYRRLLTDMHIPDWDPSFLAAFDPVDYNRTAALADFQSVMQDANSFAGLCLWPSNVGPRHGALKGRDFFGEVVRECRKRNLRIVAYYAVIFDLWAYQHHPEWRIVAENGDGNSSSTNKRTAKVCPNSPYRQYAQACLRELIGFYDIDGIFFDMTFWPEVCYCAYCEARFQKEQGSHLPRIVDWGDPKWRAFQASREAWILEFAKATTQTVKEVKPISVTHQYSSILGDWRLGIPLELRGACDYVGGDFYGGPTQYSLACKLFNSLTPTAPFEFHTSRTIFIPDFVTTKSQTELTVSAFVATLHSAACLFIDAVKPDGQFNIAAYHLMGAVNRLREPYESFLGGTLLADLAVYFDRESLYDPTQNGVSPVTIKRGGQPPHLVAVTGVARIVSEAHIPYALITNVTLDQLSSYRALFLPNVLELTAVQAELIRAFVRNGGVLIASSTSSLDRLSAKTPYFLLEDVLGVRYRGMMGTSVTYLTPLQEVEKQVFLPQEDLIYTGPMVRAETLPGTEIIAAVTLPWVAPEEGTTENGRFAQIWSNPPARLPGADPGITMHSYGKGRAVWIAAPIESTQHEVNSRLLAHLLHRVLPGPYHFTAKAHPQVEITLFDRTQQETLLLSLLNMQIIDPPSSVEAVVRIKAPAGKHIVSATHLPDQRPMKVTQDGEYATVAFGPFSMLEMAQLRYESRR